LTKDFVKKEIQRIVKQPPLLHAFIKEIRYRVKRGFEDMANNAMYLEVILK
jgi:hypothetical protein